MELTKEQLNKVRESSVDLKDKSDEELKAAIQPQLDALVQKIPDIVKTEFAKIEANLSEWSEEERAEFLRTDDNELVDQILKGIEQGISEGLA